MNLRKNQSGQSLVEYLIIVAIIAIGSIAVVRCLGQTIYVRFANITNALQGNTTEIAIDPMSDAYKKRGLNDFFKQAGGSGNESAKGPDGT